MKLENSGNGKNVYRTMTLDSFIRNYTNQTLPDDVINYLSVGPRFGSPLNTFTNYYQTSPLMVTKNIS